MSGGGRTPLPEIRELLFADLPPLQVLERYDGNPDLVALAAAVVREDAARAASVLQAILACAPETRAGLQAWALARAAGLEPPAATATRARGVVVDVGLDAGTDTLAGYEGGTARYLSHGGAAVFWEHRDRVVEEAVEALLAAGQAVADASGPLDGPRPEAPGPGVGAIWVLTEGGIHLGIGPFGALSADPLGGPVIAAGVELMRLLMEASLRDAGTGLPQQPGPYSSQA